MKMPKPIFRLFLLFLVFCFLFQVSSAQAENIDAELEKIGQEIAELEKAKQRSEAATQPLELEVDKLNQRIGSIQTSLKQAEKQILSLETSIKDREKDFAHQYELLSIRVEQLYKQLRSPSDILLLFSQPSVTQLTRVLRYRQAIAEEDKRTITEISEELIRLEEDKKSVEKNKQVLETFKQQAANQNS